MRDRRESRTSITLPLSVAQLVDTLPDEHPAFKAYPHPWRVRKDYSGHVNRSARIEAVLAYAAADRKRSKPASSKKAKTEVDDEEDED